MYGLIAWLCLTAPGRRLMAPVLTPITEFIQRYQWQALLLPVAPLALPDYAQTHAWHLYILRICPERCGMEREAFMAGLKARGIGTGIHFTATHLHPWYRERWPALALPNSEWNSSRLCSIPLFPDMTMDDIDRVVAAIEGARQPFA